MMFSGDPGAEESYEPADIFLVGSGAPPSVELALADRLCVGFCPASVLNLRVKIVLFADCPLANEGGRGVTGAEDRDAYWFSLEGDDGRWAGDIEPVAATPSLGDAVREIDDSTELGLGGGKKDDDIGGTSGVPLA